MAGDTIDVIHRKTKNGLSSAILNGIQNAKGEMIVNHGFRLFAHRRRSFPR